MKMVRTGLSCVVALVLFAAGGLCDPEGEAGPQEEAIGPGWLEFFKALGQTENGVERLAVIALVIFMAVVAYLLVMAVIQRAIMRVEAETRLASAHIRQSGQRAVTALGLLANIVKWVIGIGAVLWIMAIFNVNLGPVLAGAGIVGIAIGFGAQTLVRDTISGFFLLLEGQYAVGNYVDIGGKFGLVESIGLRVTAIKTLDNQLHYIPNGSIVAVTVYAEHFVNHVAEVPLASADDAPRAIEAIQGVVDDMLEAYPSHLPSAGPACAHTTSTGASCVRVPIAVFPTQNWLATEEFPARAKLALAGADIAMPEGWTVRTYPDLSRMPAPSPVEGRTGV
jgi:moderate conductance mechanosensitive channel